MMNRGKTQGPYTVREADRFLEAGGSRALTIKRAIVGGRRSGPSEERHHLRRREWTRIAAGG